MLLVPELFVDVVEPHPCTSHGKLDLRTLIETHTQGEGKEALSFGGRSIEEFVSLCQNHHRIL